MPAPMMDAPIMPASEPAFNNAPYNPAGQYGYNNAPGFVPNNAPMNSQPKKSKAPIFIGLGIGALVIAIIAIVLVLVLTGDDDKKKKKNEKETNKTTVEVETSTEETTTEEPTTEEPTVVVDEMDFDDAESLLIKFLNAVEDYNYTKASKYIYPPVVEYFEAEGYSADLIATLFNASFSDLDGNLLDYKISAVYLDDSDRFDEIFYDIGVDPEDCDTYIKPADFAAANIDFSYNGQTSTAQVFFVYGVDGEFYILDYEDEDFYIEFETEDPTDEPVVDGEFDFATSLAQNFISVDIPATGTVKQFDGYTLTIPDTWTISDTNCLSPSAKNAITFSNPQSISPDTKNLMLETLCDTYLNMGATNFEFGNLVANGKQGYYMEYEIYGVHMDLFIFVNSTEDKMYISIISSEDVDSDEYTESLGIAASLEIQ